MKYQSLIILFVLVLLVFVCKDASKSVVNSEKELYRPVFHFTPEANWMNDPNGMVYFDDTYHLFYQYYPDSTVWGPMHWGHAKSKDLLHWEHRPIALYPDSLGYIFSGSAVIDKLNTSGFGKNAMVAMYTYHDPVGEKEGAIDFQTQGITYSVDEGETWTKYEENPVIENPGIRDFRDPKMFWSDEKKKWQMALVAKDHVQFYESGDLKAWEKISEFRFNDDPPLGVWECPDLFKLPVIGTEEEKWVLIISHGGNSSPNGGSGTRYFVGDYDGTTFTSDQKTSQWIDYGTDNYAGVTFNNTPNNERIFIGWMSNWDYAISTPTDKWRSAMTLPRTLSLEKINEQYILRSNVIDGFKTLLSDEKIETVGNYPYEFESANLQQSAISFDAEIKYKLEIELSNSLGDTYLIVYDAAEGLFYTDRTNSGLVDFNESFLKTPKQTINIGKKEKLSVEVILDASSIEIFINDGEYVMTNQIFPKENYNLFKITPNNTELSNFKIQSVKSIL